LPGGEEKSGKKNLRGTLHRVLREQKMRSKKDTPGVWQDETKTEGWRNWGKKRKIKCMTVSDSR